MTNLKDLEVWFLTGSQHLYGEDALRQVAEHAKEMAGVLDDAEAIPVTVVYKPTATTADEIASVCRDANNTRTVSVLSSGCTPFRRPKCGLAG